MTILVRLLKDKDGLAKGADAAVDADYAAALLKAKAAIVVGGDAADFDAHPELAPAAEAPAEE